MRTLLALLLVQCTRASFTWSALVLNIKTLDQRFPASFTLQKPLQPKRGPCSTTGRPWLDQDAWARPPVKDRTRI
eukprot:1159725-Pelagomonas_calceolata.AAC.2